MTGFNFYNIAITKKRKVYYSGYYADNIPHFGKIKGAHSTKQELLLFAQIYNKDKRIKCEKPLLELIKKYCKNIREK